MGVAVVGTVVVGFEVGFEAANAGMAVGPRALLNASRRASVFPEVSEVFNLSNIFFPPPRGAKSIPPRRTAPADGLS
jgi:hypothetical protein